MTSENETVAEIVKCIRQVAHNAATANKETKESWRPAAFLATVADRIEAAHRREVDELQVALMRSEDAQVQAKFMALSSSNEIAGKNVEIANLIEAVLEKNSEVAELRECVEQAVWDRCAKCTIRTASYEDVANGYERCEHEDCECQKWRKALKGAK